jgi:hypothetical protein
MSNFVRTFKRRKIFLDQLTVGSSLSFAAAAADGTVQNFKKWRDADSNFAADWEEAIEAGTDFIEDAATDRALKKSDPLMAMILKARRPDKYDRGSKLELSGGISVEGSKQKLLNKIARLQAQGQLSGASLESVEEVPSEEPEEVEAPKLLPAPSDIPIRGSKRRAAAEGNRRKTAA